jgi:CheY-like chemotaxis protein
VIVVRDGNQALEYLRKQNDTGDNSYPAVILLDIKMPMLTGIEVLRVIKADPKLRQLPVVMLTSSREGPDVSECYRLGANAYVVKPVGFAQFFEAVKEVGRFWAVVNQPPEPKESEEGSSAVAAGRE